MSGALNLIIARGFPELGTAVQDGANKQRILNNNDAESKQIQRGNEIEIDRAKQTQQYEQQTRQTAQDNQGRLNALMQRAEQLNQFDPKDPQVQQEWRQLALEVEALKTGGGKSIVDILGMNRSQSTPGNPVKIVGPDGRPVYASAQDAIGQRAYEPPRAAPTQIVQPSYTLVPVQNPDGTVAQTMVNSRNPEQKVNLGAAPAKQNTKTSDAQTSQRTYDAFQKAIGNVEAAFKNTETGPIIGRLPAYTAEQQIAEGAVAATAPILKQMFRAAGEGVFTDRDQALLLDMAPQRSDRPEAATAKIQAIKDIVAAKLGIAPAEAPQPDPQKSYTTAGGAKVEILD